MLRRPCIALAILAFTAHVAAAQTPPTRRDILTTDAGSAVVSGRVVDDTGTPIANAEVVARAGIPQARERVVITGTDGRFEFRDLPQSSVWLRATKAGHSGRTGPSAERNVALGAKALHEDVELLLVRTGVIVGRVIGQDGEPVTGARVNAVVLRRSALGRGFQRTRGAAATDDRGAFRVFGLSPGSYYLTVTPPYRAARARGDAAATGATVTFYPGTRDPTQAVAIDVQPGAEVAADVTLVESLVYRVSGRLLGLDGQPAGNASVSLRARDALVAGTMELLQHGSVHADGRFTIEGVPQGRYVATAYPHTPLPPPAPGEWRPTPGGSTDIDVEADVDGLVVRLTLGATLRGRVVFGETAPDSLEGFQLTVRPLDMRGTSWRPPVAVSGDGSFEVSGVRGPVTFMVNGGPAPAELLVARAAAAGNATPAAVPRPRLEARVVGGIVDGRGNQASASANVVAAIRRGGAVWRTRAVRVEGRLAPGLVVDAGHDGVVDGVEIEVAQDHASARGVVRDPRGAPFVGAEVLALATDERLVQVAEGALRGRATSQDDGRYFLFGLPPGTWDLVAVDAASEQVSGYSDGYLDRLRTSATRVTIGPREHATIDLTVVKP